MDVETKYKPRKMREFSFKNCRTDNKKCVEISMDCGMYCPTQHPGAAQMRYQTG